MLEREVQHVNTKLDDMRLQIKAVADNMAKQKVCPAPGACIELTRRVEAIEMSEKQLTEALNKALGGAKVLIAVGAALGTVIGILGKTAVSKIWP